MVDKDKALASVKEAREKSKKRNFTQSFEVSITTKSLDYKKPDNRFNLEIVLPKGRGKDKTVALFAKKALAEQAKGKVNEIITEDALSGIAKKASKTLANQYDIFLAEPSLMGVVGKNLGTVFGPRQKMPKPVPNAAALDSIVPRLKNTVRLNNKSKGQNCLQVPVGSDAMSDEDVAENLLSVVKTFKDAVEAKGGLVKNAFVKTTMGERVALIGGKSK